MTTVKVRYSGIGLKIQLKIQRRIPLVVETGPFINKRPAVVKILDALVDRSTPGMKLERLCEVSSGASAQVSPCSVMFGFMFAVKSVAASLTGRVNALLDTTWCPDAAVGPSLAFCYGPRIKETNKM